MKFQRLCFERCDLLLQIGKTLCALLGKFHVVLVFPALKNVRDVVVRYALALVVERKTVVLA
jgi:hypothetical protein